MMFCDIVGGKNSYKKLALHQKFGFLAASNSPGSALPFSAQASEINEDVKKEIQECADRLAEICTQRPMFNEWMDKDTNFTVSVCEGGESCFRGRFLLFEHEGNSGGAEGDVAPPESTGIRFTMGIKKMDRGQVKPRIELAHDPGMPYKEQTIVQRNFQGKALDIISRAGIGVISKFGTYSWFSNNCRHYVYHAGSALNIDMRNYAPACTRGLERLSNTEVGRIKGRLKGQIERQQSQGKRQVERQQQRQERQAKRQQQRQECQTEHRRSQQEKDLNESVSKI